MLDPQEEARFDDLRAKCRELKVPAPPEIMIGLQVHENGVLTFDDVQRGHSWTRNYYNVMITRMIGGQNTTTANFGAGYLSIKSGLGTTAGTYDQEWMKLGSLTPSKIFADGAAGLAWGIVVGSSSTTFSPDHYLLGALIPNGTLAYQAMNGPNMSYLSKTWTATASRIFNNNSGGAVIVAEAGIYGDYNCAGTWQLDRVCMLERSVLSPTVAVANGAQLTVTYNISMDFSAID